MGFQDRRYNSDDSGGGFRSALRRIFVNGEGFFGWSFPLFTVPRAVPGIAGIHVRVHLLYILIVISELLSARAQDSVGLTYMLAMMGTLFILVLLHEFGHCLACRLVGGEADQILMWPLGGLAFCRPPHRWKPALITTVAGPGVNLALVPILGGALLACGARWSSVIFNPMTPNVVFSDPFFAGGVGASILWSAYYTNLFLFLFNVLLPMFPMDSGRILQEILWWRIGYKRSMEIAVNTGLVVAVALGLFGMSQGSTRLMALALFGGITCYNERQRVRMMEDQPAWAYDTDRGYQGLAEQEGPSSSEGRAYKKAVRRQEEQRKTQAEVDRILDKIRDQGMASLTKRESAFLRDETERSRREA